VIARRLRRCRPQPSNRWHLDEMVVRIAGDRMFLWRAVDHEGEVLDMLVQPRRAALRLMRELLKKQRSHSKGILQGLALRNGGAGSPIAANARWIATLPALPPFSHPSRRRLMGSCSGY